MTSGEFLALGQDDLLVFGQKLSRKYSLVEIASLSCRLLDLASQCAAIRLEEIDKLRQMCLDQKSWNRGKDMFHQIRKKTIEAEASKSELLISYLLLAEICAKTCFNASADSHRFDTDTPEWIPSCVASIAKQLEHSKARDELIAYLISS